MTEVAVESPPKIKLDLACGSRPKDGFEGADFFCPTAKHRFNLCEFPWPFADDSVQEIFCSHFIEHLPMVYVAKDGKTFKQVPDDPEDRDLFCRFMDECWRILCHGGKAEFHAPNARSDRGFQDPTHRRFIVPPTFYYFHQPWVIENGLGHYLGKANFDISVRPDFFMRELATYHPSAQERIGMEYWNVIGDWVAILTANKQEPGSAPSKEKANGL